MSLIGGDDLKYFQIVILLKPLPEVTFYSILGATPCTFFLENKIVRFLSYFYFLFI